MNNIEIVRNKSFFILPSSLNDKFIRGSLLVAGLHAQGMLAPGSLRVFQTNWVVAFAAAMWMVNRVHGFAAHRWADAPVAVAPRFADSNIHPVRIGNLADGGQRNDRYIADFAGLEHRRRK